MDIHVVRAGETVSSVAARYGVPAGILAGINGVVPDAPLAVGQTLVVRHPRELHTVASGESVYSIALRYGLSVRTLYQNNPALGGRSALYPGQTLVIAYDDAPLRTLAVNAYSYPFIRGGLLDAALPYLTYLTPFTYGINADGTLLPLADEWLLAAAGQYRTAALMHLSTLTEEGRFDSARSTLILEDADAQDALVQSILETVQARHYFGLDVDFEYVLPEQREAYAAFITRLREALNPLGCPVVVALAPKTSAAQRGLLYEAHDYALLGAAANAVFLMTYEWGYTYGPPMAVAPLPSVRRVVEFALTEMPPEKIFLGFPNYAYDWTLPYAPGTTRAQSIGNEAAVQLAVNVGAEIRFDEQAQTPWFAYTDGESRAHEVWFEDARSSLAKYRLVTEYGLCGIGYWNFMRPFTAGFALLNAVFRLEP